jgi:hypothetical protein
MGKEVAEVAVAAVVEVAGYRVRQLKSHLSVILNKNLFSLQVEEAVVDHA